MNVFCVLFLKLNYESIDGGEDFSGHISLKVGKSVYSFNFLTGDKTHSREEAFDESGMIYGKFTSFNEKKQSKVIVSLILLQFLCIEYNKGIDFLVLFCITVGLSSVVEIKFSLLDFINN
jgi:hypothetical protein